MSRFTRALPEVFDHPGIAWSEYASAIHRGRDIESTTGIVPVAWHLAQFDITHDEVALPSGVAGIGLGEALEVVPEIRTGG